MNPSAIWLNDLAIVAALFLLGLVGLLVMRNLVKLLICAELLTKGVTLAPSLRALLEGAPT